MDALPEHVLDALGVRVIAELGQRVNAHWRVRYRGEDAVLRRWGYDEAQLRWETLLADRLAALAWPTPTLLADPVELDGTWWTVHRMLSGAHRERRDPHEQRELGRTMARLHLDLAPLGDLPQRPGWRTATEILADPAVDALLAAEEPRWPEDMRIMRRHLDRARMRLAEIGPLPAATPVIHGDAAPTNVLWSGDRLTGLLDLEIAHRDSRIAEFALGWRGRYDDVVHGYEEVVPLAPEERALLGPVFWARVIGGGAELLARGGWEQEDGWIRRMLERRSPLMGADADWSPHGPD